MAVTTEEVVAFVRRCAEVVAEHKRELVKLDSAIGDADHGENLDRGFRAAVERLGDSDPVTPSEVLKTVSTALVSKVGGAAGPLYGTAFLRASTALDGRDELDAAGVVEGLEAALEGVRQRGKADVGDKTMIDALAPAVEAARDALVDGGQLADVLGAAGDAAEQGMNDTTPLLARKGRASYLGERSKGHQDPGATSTHLLIRALASTDE